MQGSGNRASRGGPAAIVLAAGKSTRMRSEVPKVLHEICGRPMLGYVLEACRDAGAREILVVVGHGQQRVRECFGGEGDLIWVEQAEQKGTGHAVQMCEQHLARRGEEAVLVVAGDMPLLRGAVLRALLEAHRSAGNAATVATAVLDDPTGYGRILRDGQGRFLGIAEDRDATDAQRAIREVNVSCYCFQPGPLLEALGEIRPDNAKGEYYLTDVLGVLRERGERVDAVALVPPEQALGVNTRADLAVISRLMQDRIQASWMERGVTIVDPESTWIEYGASAGADVTIYPFSFVARGARIEPGSRVGPFAHVRGVGGAGEASCTASQEVSP